MVPLFHTATANRPAAGCPRPLPCARLGQLPAVGTRASPQSSCLPTGGAAQAAQTRRTDLRVAVLTGGWRWALPTRSGPGEGGREEQSAPPGGRALGGGPRQAGDPPAGSKVPSRGAAQPCPRDNACPCSEVVALSPATYHAGSKGALTSSPVPVMSIKSHNSQNPFCSPVRRRWERKERRGGPGWGRRWHQQSPGHPRTKSPPGPGHPHSPLSTRLGTQWAPA